MPDIIRLDLSSYNEEEASRLWDRCLEDGARCMNLVEMKRNSNPDR